MSQYIRVHARPHESHPDKPAVPMLVNAFKVELIHQVPGQPTVIELQARGKQSRTICVFESIDQITEQLQQGPKQEALD